VNRVNGFLVDDEPPPQAKAKPAKPPVAAGYCRCADPFVDEDSEGEDFCWRCGRPLPEGDE